MESSDDNAPKERDTHLFYVLDVSIFFLSLTQDRPARGMSGRWPGFVPFSGGHVDSHTTATEATSDKHARSVVRAERQRGVTVTGTAFRRMGHVVDMLSQKASGVEAVEVNDPNWQTQLVD